MLGRGELMALERTMELRFIDRKEVVTDGPRTPYHPTNHARVRVLQQLWRDPEDGAESWRDVPLVKDR